MGIAMRDDSTDKTVAGDVRPIITDSMLAKWQGVVDLIIEIIGVPACLINRVSAQYMEVFIANEGHENPFSRGQKFPRQDDLYCQGAIARRDLLVIPDAREEDHWKHNPNLDFGMVSYMGCPIQWPDGTIFGTLCVLDTKPNAYTDLFKKLLRQSGDVIEHDLRIVTENTERVRLESRRLAEQTIQDFYENAPFGFQSLDADGRFLDVNQTWLTLLGYAKKDDIIGRWFGDFLTPDYVETFKTNFPRFKAAGKIDDIEFNMVKKDGTPVWMSFNGRIVYDDQGGFVRTQCLMRDVTEQRRAQTLLRRNEEMTRNLLNATDDTAFLLDLDGRFVALNDAMAGELGRTRDELIGKNAFSFLPGGMVQGKMAIVKQVITSGQPVRFEDNHLESIVDYHMYPVRDASDNVIQVAIYVRDITERKRLHDALVANEQRLSLAQQAAQAGVWDWDLVTNKITWSEEHRLLMDDHASEPSYENWLNGVHPDDRTAADIAVKRSVTDKTDFNIEYRICRSDGSLRWINDRGVTFYDDNGTPRRMIGICIDITERKQAEIEMHNLALLVQNSSEGVCLADLNGRIVFANDAGSRMVGIPQTEIDQHSIYEVMPESCREIAKNEVIPSIKERGCWEGDLQYRNCQTGELIDVYATTFLIKDPNTGQPLFLASVSHDITERKRREEEDRLDQRRLNSLLRISQHKTVSAKELLDFALEEAVVLSDSKLGFISYYSEKDEKFSLHSWSRAVIEQCAIADPTNVFPLKKAGISGEVIRQRRPVVINDFQTPNPPAKTCPEGHVPLIRYLSLPVIIDGQIVGVVGVANKNADYTEADVRQLGLMMDSVWAVVRRKEAEKILRESEAKYRATFENTGTATVLLEEDTTISLANREFQRLSGYSREEIEGKKSWTEFVAKEDLEMMRVRHDQRRRCPESIFPSYEFHFVRKSGEVRHIFLSTDLIPGSKRGIASLLDITERKRAEEELRKSESVLRSIFDAAPSGVALIVDRKLKKVNNCLCRITGYTEEELLGQDTRILYLNDADYIRAGQELYGQVARTGLGMHGVRLRRKDEVEIDALICLSPFNPNDLSKGVTATVLDISEQKRIEEALRESENKFHEMADLLPVTLWESDLDGNITYANRRASEDTGYSHEDIAAGFNVFSITVPEERERARTNVDRTLKGEIPSNHEYMAVRKDGTIFPAMVYSNLIYRGGKPVGLRGILVDISERKRIEQELRDSEKKFSELAKLLPVAIWESDLQGNITYANRQTLQENLYSQTDLDAGVNIFSLIVPCDQDRTRQFLGQLLQGGTTDNHELGMIRKDGTTYPVIAYTNVIRHDGQPIGYRGIAINIADRKKVEEALRKSEEKYRHIVELASEGIWVVGSDLRCNYANKCMFDMLGVPADGMIGHSLLDFVFPDDASFFRKKMRQRTEGHCDRYISRLCHAEGSEVWCLVSATPIFESDGAFAGSFAMFTDITPLRQAEQALRESEEKFRAVFESAQDWLFIKNKELKYTNVNPSVERLFDLSADQLIGKTDADIFGEKIAAHTRLTDQSVLQGEIVDEEDTRTINGEPRTLHIIKVPMRDGQSVITGICGITRDITEKKEMEKELLRAEKLDALGLLAGGIAHDFNNILTAVLGNVSFAKMDIDPAADAFQCLTDVEKASLRAKDLTQQLLTFSKGGAPIKEASLIEEIVIDSAQFALRGSNVKCSFSIAADLYHVNIDRGQISQVISNLVINADQAMPSGGSLRISINNAEIDEPDVLPLPPGKYVHVAVADEGIGIPESIQAKIFDPFFTTKQRGNGLGLATSYSIIRKHDGHIWLESQPGAGTTFHIYLPATTEEVKGISKSPVPIGNASGNILIMDDESAICQVAARSLNRLGYKVKTTSEGADAVAAYKTAMEMGKPYDVVILDLTVPGGMGGRETIAQLKLLDPNVKAIVSSGYSNDPEIADYADFGFCGRIAKPFKTEDLARAVSEALGLATEAQ